jgi:SHS2 domain-containing protein
MKKFRFLEEVATADVAFKAYGQDWKELFENSALALFEAMVETEAVGQQQTATINLENKTIEDLLFDFLDQLVFLKDSKGMVFSQFEVTIEGEYRLKAEVSGEEINPSKHRLKTDVKAVTLHRFKVGKTNQGCQCRVVLDV